MVWRIGLLVALAIVLAAVLVLSGPVATAQTDQNGGISVVGEGQVLATPDLARVTFGVEQTDPSLSQAMANARTSMEAVLTRLEQLGVSREDIQTVDFSVSPIYDNRGDAAVLRGYRVSNAVRVTLRDFNQVGSVLDEVVAAGATRVQGISFGTSREAELHDQAREQAVADARRKAEQLARAAGVSLGSITSIDASGTGGVSPVREMSVAQAAATPIEGGQLEIRTMVRVTWAIGP